MYWIRTFYLLNPSAIDLFRSLACRAWACE